MNLVEIWQDNNSLLKLGDNMKDDLSKFSVLFYSPILVYMFLLVSFSLVAIYSSYPLSQEQYPIGNNFVTRQVLFFGVGTLILMIVLLLGLERMKLLRWWFYGGGMVLLLGIFIHTQTSASVPFVFGTKGATRWYRIGPISLQPSEFMRIALILVVADLIQVHNRTYSRLKRTIKFDFILIVKVIAVVIPPAILIYKQPDSGITLLILITTAIMLLIGGIHWRYIIVIGGLTLFIVSLFIITANRYPDILINTLGIAPYRISRFSGWFDPFGTISGEGNQLARGMVAIGSGGLLGNGLQSGLIYFPEAHTDFIFAVIGKDFGLIGSLALVILYGLFNFEILNTSLLNENPYHRLVCSGIFASLVTQQFWNIGMCLGLLPISGLTLPFISHGGSSVLASMILFGLILSSYVEGSNFYNKKARIQKPILYLNTKPYLKKEIKKKNL